MMLEDFGLEPERFRIEWIASSEAQKFADVMTEMTEQLRALGPSPTAPGDNKGKRSAKKLPLSPFSAGFNWQAEANLSHGGRHRHGPSHWPERSTAKNSCGTASSTTVTSQAQQVMEGYAKDGFEVEKFVEDGQFLVYSRRVATVDKSGD